MRVRATAFAVLSAGLVLAGGALAQPAMPAQAGMCVTCHGQNGLASMPGVPHLAGQPEIYLREQLRLYRSGRRQNEIMGVIAKPLSDADIETLAGWYAGFKVEVSGR